LAGKAASVVLDLLPKIAGELSSQDDGHNLIATLKSIDNKPY
jgi:hypothetical protein